MFGQKARAVIGVVMLALLGAPPSLIETSTCSLVDLESIIEGRDSLPSLASVQAAARAAWARHGHDPSWAARARWRGLVPRIDIAVGTDADFDVRDSIDTRTTVEGRALGVRVSARFELGDLVFAESEVRASRERAARAAELRTILRDLTELYFRRVELLLAIRLAPTAPLLLEAKSIDGLIDALTDGQLR